MTAIPQPPLGDCPIECWASPYPRTACACKCEGKHHGIRDAWLEGMGLRCGEQPKEPGEESSKSPKPNAPANIQLPSGIVDLLSDIIAMLPPVAPHSAPETTTDPTVEPE